MNSKNNLFLQSILFYFIFFSHAHSFVLMTDEEVEKYSKGFESKNCSQPSFKILSATPAIEPINSNLLSNNISSPITIKLSFMIDEVRIFLECFKTLYGTIKFDITKKILKKTDIKTNSIHLENTEVPRNRHKFTIKISDEIGRVSVREFILNVK